MDKDLKAAVSAQVKAMKDLQKALKAIEDLGPPVEVIDAPAKLVKAHDLVQKQKKELSKAVTSTLAEGEVVLPKAVKSYKGFLKRVDDTLAKAIKMYQGAVKDTDGLTSVRPATLKALQTASKDPSAKTIEVASKGLDAHSADLKKASGNDKAAKKKIAAFDKEVAAIKAHLQKL